MLGSRQPMPSGSIAILLKSICARDAPQMRDRCAKPCAARSGSCAAYVFRVLPEDQELLPLLVAENDTSTCDRTASVAGQRLGKTSWRSHRNRLDFQRPTGKLVL